MSGKITLDLRACYLPARSTSRVSVIAIVIPPIQNKGAHIRVH